ncbi:hypothetical protein D3C81_1039680 [compost metagenome]
MLRAPRLQLSGQPFEALTRALVVAGRLLVQLGDQRLGGLLDARCIIRRQPQQALHVQHAPLHARGRPLCAFVGTLQPFQGAGGITALLGQFGQLRHVVVRLLAALQLGQQQGLGARIVIDLTQRVDGTADGGLARMRVRGCAIGGGHALLHPLNQGCRQRAFGLLLAGQRQFGQRA